MEKSKIKIKHISGPIHPRLQAMVDHKDAFIDQSQQAFKDRTVNLVPVTELTAIFHEEVMDLIISKVRISDCKVDDE